MGKVWTARRSKKLAFFKGKKSVEYISTQICVVKNGRCFFSVPKGLIDLFLFVFFSGLFP